MGEVKIGFDCSRALAREEMALAISQDERYASSLMASPTPFDSSLDCSLNMELMNTLFFQQSHIEYSEQQVSRHFHRKSRHIRRVSRHFYQVSRHK